MRVKMSKQPPPAPTASAVGPCPTLIQTSRTPRTWKFIQDHRTIRPPPVVSDDGSKSETLFRTAQATAALTKLKPIWKDNNISLE